MDDDALAREQARRLREALERAVIGSHRLWLRYLGLGGREGELEVEAYLHECLVLPARQRDLLAWAANTLLDPRVHPRVPSTRDLVPPESGGRGPAEG
ncbi:hypothetical protein AS188_00795 [Kocuria flava]|uniref:Uncharacterized protein n=1 Tax=Kocuria flava TaxID=446860 RepID=A0A0U3GER9_9MICC|nr:MULTISPECIES: hypothetical protein [Kocuria]ALU38526.1 hypothetical protein AS188_00795 [Kocuria flava]MCD1145398.1 hypothetical protein [Kocuria sp. LUK]MCJ8505554.1 hypothetical protein [Kocuria flava]PLC11957.1 hypothetical protein AUQ48_06555 [Kocuria flava]GEO92775.1 hypothetical protein KFL01_20810 [Kocuria flava]